MFLFLWGNLYNLYGENAPIFWNCQKNLLASLPKIDLFDIILQILPFLEIFCFHDRKKLCLNSITQCAYHWFASDKLQLGLIDLTSCLVRSSPHIIKDVLTPWPFKWWAQQKKFATIAQLKFNHSIEITLVCVAISHYQYNANTFQIFIKYTPHIDKGLY